MTTKRKVLQYFLFWLYTLFALGIPSILIADTYGLLKKPTGYTAGKGLILIAIVSLFYFRKHIGRMIENMQPSFLKHILIAIRELMPLIIVYVVFLITTIQFDNITFILKWSCISNAVALGVRAWHLNVIEENKKLINEGSE